MTSKRYYWLRLKEDFFDERYIKALRRLPQGDSLVIVYLKMQLKSLKTEGIIKYEGILPDSIAELAMALDEDENIVKLAVEGLVRFGVVERWDDETLYMSAMQQLIGSESDSAARVRKHRALQSNGVALPSNSDVTACNTEKEKEKEIEIDKEKENKKSTDYQAIVNAYNETCVSFPAVQKLSEGRKKAIKARMNSGYTQEDFTTLFRKAQESDFLKGKNDRNWRATFDWLIKDNNMAKVLDGNYDNKGGSGHGQSARHDESDASQWGNVGITL